MHIGLKNIHSGERIQKVPDPPANSSDTCGRKAYPKRKSYEFKNIRIRVGRDEVLITRAQTRKRY